MSTATRSRSKKPQVPRADTVPHTAHEAPLPSHLSSRDQEPLEQAQRTHEGPEARETHQEAPDAGRGIDTAGHDTIPSFRGRS
jgi:hypothetical protein